ncbi:MAG: DUF1573 domain-containing protein [Ferruginibacter sp.]|nr:DUF1573 domain-containing protein [Ferruginibacter sp.]
MKKVLFSLAAIAISTGIFAQVKSDDIAKIKNETVELGKIPQGVPAPAVFTVLNTGKTDLIIESANPTCGCTIGDYTKTPIAPGKTGTITATYNAGGVGAFEKHMNVKFAGAEDTKSITLKGEVLTTEDYAKLKAGIPATMATAPTKADSPVAATTTKKKKSKKKSCVKC